MLLALQQLPIQVPRPDSTARRDSIGLSPVGRAAERLLRDSLHAVPGQLASWWHDWAIAAVRLLPRILLALAVVALLLSVTLWLRGVARRRLALDEDATAPRQVGTIGLLLAATIGCAIVGATTIAAALLTFVVFYAVAALIQAFGIGLLGRSRAAPEAIDLVLTVGRYALLTLGAVEALATLGLNLGGVIAGLGILGLAMGFAAQDTLANLIAGFMILWDRPLRVGDWVRVGDALGRVRQLTLRTTRIETPDNGILVIPNKDVTGSQLFNYSLRKLTRVRVPVDVDYGADIDAVRRTLLSIVPTDETQVSTRPAPEVVVTELGESGVRVELLFYILDPRDEMPLRWRLNEEILVAFRRAGIVITYPQLSVHVEKD